MCWQRDRLEIPRHATPTLRTDEHLQYTFAGIRILVKIQPTALERLLFGLENDHVGDCEKRLSNPQRSVPILCCCIKSN